MGDEKLRRRIPVLRKMGFIRYHGSKDLAPARNITFNRCWHGKLMALRKRTIRHRIESASCTHTMCPYPSRSCRQPCAAICRSRSGPVPPRARRRARRRRDATSRRIPTRVRRERISVEEVDRSRVVCRGVRSGLPLVPPGHGCRGRVSGAAGAGGPEVPSPSRYRLVPG
jgi:hypothetical protein